MNTEQNTLSLWKELNEKRTQGEWIVTTNNEFIGNGKEPIFTTADKRSETSKANTQYTALAVNNFASVCKALELMLDGSNAPEWKIKVAKQVLNNIK